MAGVEYQVTKVDPTNPETKGMVYQVHKVSEEVAATLGGKVYRARIIKDPSDPAVAGKVYQIVLIDDPDDLSVKGKVYNAILTGGSEVVVIGPAVSPLSLPDAIADSLSYVKAFGGTEQRNIPQPYTQVNYVTNTAQTAVDTGIMIDFAKNYEFEVECRAVSGSWYILQSRASASGNVTGIHGETSGSTIKLVVGNVTVCTSAITRTVGNKLYVKATLNAGTATLYVKDETANTEDTQTGSYGTSQPNPTAAVYLLGNAGGQYVDVNSDIYMARIKENDTVVMDYVPARQVATAGFFDTVSGTFKTAETPANLSADGNTVPTPDAPMDIVSNNGVLKWDSVNQKIYTDGTVETIAIKDDQSATVSSATAEMLLSVGDYTDEQEILSGAVTRKVGVKVLDGTEGWVKQDASSGVPFATFNLALSTTAAGGLSNVPRCSHFRSATNTGRSGVPDNGVGVTANPTYTTMWFRCDSITTTNDFTTWLAAQYAAGTPVIIVYPLATPTTETVTPQPMQTAAGDNTVEITQASLNGLELEAEYEKEA